MARRRAGGDVLGTIEACLAAVRDRADAAGVTLDLVVPVNPALVGADTTSLGDVGRHLLRYALGRAKRGHRLVICLDRMADGTVTLEIGEHRPGRARGQAPTGLPGDDESDADLAIARRSLDAAGGGLSIARDADGLLRLSAKVPGSQPPKR